MDFALIAILQLFGIALHGFQKLIELDAKSPDDSKWDVFKLMWKNDGFSFGVSFVVLGLNEVTHFIVARYSTFAETFENYYLWSFLVAFVLGYAGQRVIYKYLGRAEEFLNKKVENKLQ
jgi:hypothetical protein